METKSIIMLSILTISILIVLSCSSIKSKKGDSYQGAQFQECILKHTGQEFIDKCTNEKLHEYIKYEIILKDLKFSNGAVFSSLLIDEYGYVKDLKVIEVKNNAQNVIFFEAGQIRNIPQMIPSKNPQGKNVELYVTIPMVLEN